MASPTPPGIPVPFEALGPTFNDALLQPNESGVIPSEVTTCTWFSRNVRLDVLLSSMVMDTVMETHMAIAVAREGDIGILHRNLFISDQVYMVDQVRRLEVGMVIRLVTIGPGASFQEVDKVCAQYRIPELSVVNDDGTLLGIITNRDLRFEDDGIRPVSKVMTKMPLVTAFVGISNDDALALLAKGKIEELPIVDSWGRLKGLITLKNFVKVGKYPNVAKDDVGRLRAGATVGFFGNTREQAMAPVEQRVDYVIVDTAYGRPRGVVGMIRRIKANPTAARAGVIGGNAATCVRAWVLVEVGVNGAKVSVGPGSICTTHVVAGAGVLQVTVICDAARTAGPHGVSVTGDGGFQHFSDIARIIVTGANSVVFGSLLVGCEESPGDLMFINDKQFRAYRGMGSLGAVVARDCKASYLKSRYFQGDVTSDDKSIPEGIGGQVVYRDPSVAAAYQLVGGLRQSTFYSGARMVDELQECRRSVRVTAVGPRGSYPHDIQLTAEAPSY